MKYNSIDVVVDDTKETLITASNDKQIVGTVSIGYKNKKSAYIRMLYVDVNYRRMGIASTLLEYCRDLTSKEKCESISLVVKTDNDIAIKFYKKSGFIIAYDYDDGSFLMSLIL